MDEVLGGIYNVGQKYVVTLENKCSRSLVPEDSCEKLDESVVEEQIHFQECFWKKRIDLGVYVACPG